MKLALALLLFATTAHADWFYHDDNIEITLYDDLCEPNLLGSKMAMIQPIDHKGKTTGCWDLGDDKTYVIKIDLLEGNGSFYQYDIYRDKFKLIEEK